MIANIEFDGSFERHFMREAASEARGEIANAIRTALADEAGDARWEAVVFWHEEHQAVSVELKKDGKIFDKRPAANRDAGDFLSWNAESRRSR